MKRLVPYLPAGLSAIALGVFVVAFVCEYNSFKNAVVGWAMGDLSARSELAAETLSPALATDDFKRIREFGEICSADGMRLTVRSKSGGVFYDTAPGDSAPMFWRTSESSGSLVSVGIPKAVVMRPFFRAATGFLLAGLIGTAGVLLFFFVTYRQRVRIRELSRLERFRREFIADVSHEIKTPLAGIMGAAELLGDADSLPEGCRKQTLAMIRRESGRLDSLVRNILSLSKLERGRDGGFDFAVCDLAEIARECVGRFAGRAGAAGIVLELHAGSGAVCIDCDAAQISRALDNLIANAIFHSSSDRITVTVSESGPFAVAAVEDHGVGIPPGHRERVFERFHRVDPSRSDSTGGSGLGLSIVRGIARLHGGEVRLEEAKPAGCRFSLLLPRCRRRPPNIGIISSHIQGAR
jgi:signal transduction histidine kinase